MADSAWKPHPSLLTISLEDYFHVGAFNRVIHSGQWYRFESRLERNALRTLDLLDEYNITATFFALGWVAERVPELLRTITERGHEVANRGFYPRSTRQLTPGEFADDLARSSEALERASGQRVRGYRAARLWREPSDLWALRSLAEAGYAYDSSVLPIGRGFTSQPWRYVQHDHVEGAHRITEFPISSTSIGGLRLPFGGNYLRQLPQAMMHRAAAHWNRSEAAPFTMYFQVWELDADQPKISAAPMLQRVRQYRNLPRMEALVRWYFERFEFKSAMQLLDLPLELAAISPPRPVPAVVPGVAAPPVADRLPVTIVVPCFNEESVLTYLSNTLQSVQEHLAHQYSLRFVFVDDCSTDGTWDALHRTFGSWPNVHFEQHAVNGGVAAAIMTGIRAADSEIVCSIDADCTYDPHELGGMIPLLVPGVDLVTASPYHPEGGVRNVAEWRLVLSRGASSLYRIVLHNKLHTYTSCFRVYRRSAALELTLTRRGFLGVMETIGLLDLDGHRVAEYPTMLDVRMIGQSKMKVARTIWGHLQLLTQFGKRRWFGPPPSQPYASGERAVTTTGQATIRV